MSIKRGIISLITGLTAEVAALWSLDYYTHLNLIPRVDWADLFVWIFILVGFLTAHWLLLWSKFLNKVCNLFHKKSPEKSQPKSGKAVEVTPAPQNRVIPARMNVQNNAILSVDPNNPNQTTAEATNTPTISTRSEPSQKDQDIETLCGLEPDLDMMAFKHVNLEGKNIDLVYSSDTNAILCTVFSEEHSWTVDTSVSIDQSMWTDETGHTVQPCLLLLRQAAALEKMEPDSVLTPTVLLMRGLIKNYEEAIPYLEQNHITVATYQPSTMPNVKTIRDLLILYFTPFPPSYDDVSDAFKQSEAAEEEPIEEEEEEAEDTTENMTEETELSENTQQNGEDNNG